MVQMLSLVAEVPFLLAHNCTLKSCLLLHSSTNSSTQTAHRLLPWLPVHVSILKAHTRSSSRHMLRHVCLLRLGCRHKPLHPQALEHRP
jgi:hypothetical protein